MDLAESGQSPFQQSRIATHHYVSSGNAIRYAHRLERRRSPANLWEFYAAACKSVWKRYGLMTSYRPSCNEADGRSMLDAILIVSAVAFFLVACGYAALCERM
jgi:hypothetical protein